ncbi:MAG: nuclear transport factor 2 family protein [Anaerolineales bacterium]|jgi:ketosteroid isomerase-like protein
MMTNEQNEAAARRCIAMYNQRTTEWVKTCYAPNAEWTELPLPATPTGQHGNRAFLIQVAQRILNFFPDRQMEILNIVTRGDQVVLELDWRGIAAANLGTLQAGSSVRYRVATFLTFAEGLIVKHIDYCVPMPNDTA